MVVVVMVVSSFVLLGNGDDLHHRCGCAGAAKAIVSKFWEVEGSAGFRGCVIGVSY